MGALGAMKVVACGHCCIRFHSVFSSFQLTAALIGAYDLIVLLQYLVRITSLTGSK